MDTFRVLQFILVLGLCISAAHSSYYQEPVRRYHMAQPAQSRVVHVHHYDKGGSYGGSGYSMHGMSGMSGGYGHKMKGSGGGDSLINLLVLSSLLGNGNGGLFGTPTNTNTNALLG